MLLSVTKYGEAILHRKGERVQLFDRTLARLAEDMVETMYAYEGIGLAAQQVNQSVMLCVLDLQLAGKEFEIEYRFDGKQPPLELLMPWTIDARTRGTSTIEMRPRNTCPGIASHAPTCSPVSRETRPRSGPRRTPTPTPSTMPSKT